MDRIEYYSENVCLTQLLDNLQQIVVCPENAEDLPPEYCTYQDEGCEFFPACLECPLPQCILDNLTAKQQRDNLIIHLHIEQNLSLVAVAKKLGISKSTVMRALKSHKK